MPTDFSSSFLINTQLCNSYGSICFLNAYPDRISINCVETMDFNTSGLIPVQ